MLSPYRPAYCIIIALVLLTKLRQLAEILMFCYFACVGFNVETVEYKNISFTVYMSEVKTRYTLSILILTYLFSCDFFRMDCLPTVFLKLINTPNYILLTIQ